MNEMISSRFQLGSGQDPLKIYKPVNNKVLALVLSKITTEITISQYVSYVCSEHEKLL